METSVKRDPTEEKHAYILQRNKQCGRKRLAARNIFSCIDQETLYFQRLRSKEQRLRSRMERILLRWVAYWAIWYKKSLCKDDVKDERDHWWKQSRWCHQNRRWRDRGENIRYLWWVGCIHHRCSCPPKRSIKSQAEMERLARQYARGRCCSWWEHHSSGNVVKFQGFVKGEWSILCDFISSHHQSKYRLPNWIRFCSNTEAEKLESNPKRVPPQR